MEVFKCNIDAEFMQENEKKEVDFDGLRYMVGEVNYIGKMADNIDRQKMRIIVSKHLNKDILQSNHQMWQGTKLPQNPSEVMTAI